MKRFPARIVLVAIGTASCAFMFYFSWVRVHAVDGATCTFDAALSSAMQQQIAARASELSGFYPDALICILIEQFPCIWRIGLQLRPNNHAHITISAQIPVLRVNEAEVLTKTARLIDQSDFDSQLISKLSHITIAPEVAHDAQQLKELQRTAAHIDPSLFAQYNVMWRNAHEVLLIDHVDNAVQFVCCAYQLEDNGRMKRYRDQVAQLMEARAESAPRKKQLVADLRFENQIILRGPAASIVQKNSTSGC